MKDIDWRAIDRRELATLLANSKRVSSRAIGATTIYRLDHDGREIIAMALPDGAAVIVERAPLAKWRRRIDAQRTTPASR
ncbi:MAG: hypothetical protein PHY45_15610 [Rhodocyclaceae bacterium]|nr:hypothetical protein [Rhodocyclaceae bacterium]